MSYLNLYPDCWEYISRFLDNDSLYNLSLVNKNTYRACQKYYIQKRLSEPLLMPYKLTYDQRQVVKKMSDHNHSFKIINGDVGSGKTLTSLFYIIRKYQDSDIKVVMIAPPSLMKMWKDTLEKFFDITPKVLHSMNKKYVPKQDWLEVPEEKFIITSVNLWSRRQPKWFDDNPAVIIFDEAHHNFYFDVGCFIDIIALSATLKKKNTNISWNIKRICNIFHTSVEEASFKLQKSCIARSLPDIKYHSYLDKNPLDQNYKNYIKSNFQYTAKGKQSQKCLHVISKILAHPQIYEIQKGIKKSNGILTNGRKKFRVNHFTIFANKDEFDPLWCDEYYKYRTTLQIVQWAKDNNQKVLVFDTSADNLPFLHSYFIKNGIKSFLYSTHYSVTSRQKQLENFQQSGDVLISSINMLGEGHNITEANNVVFLSHCLESAKYIQAVGRCWRYPQDKVVNIHLIFRCKIEVEMYKHACKNVSALDYERWDDLL